LVGGGLWRSSRLYAVVIRMAAGFFYQVGQLILPLYNDLQAKFAATKTGSATLPICARTASPCDARSIHLIPFLNRFVCHGWMGALEGGFWSRTAGAPSFSSLKSMCCLLPNSSFGAVFVAAPPAATVRVDELDQTPPTCHPAAQPRSYLSRPMNSLSPR
jgi:hypothetical protein